MNITGGVNEVLSGSVFQASRTGALTQVGGERRSRAARIRAALRGRDGSALVEMAVTLPVMMLIMTGIFSFSVALYQKIQLTEATSNGGRVLAVARGDTDPCKTASTAVLVAAPSLSPSKLTFKFVLNGVSQSGTTCPAATLGNAGGTAQITTSYTCSIGVYGFSYPGCKVAAQITENVQ